MRRTSAARSAAASRRSTPAPAQQIWKTYTIAEEAKKRGVTKEGVQAWGPAGGGIWSAPTIDARRRVLYVSTGNGYADPPQPTTDAVIAMDLDKGTIKWVSAARAERRLDDGLPGEEPGQPALPGRAGARPRLLRVADAREEIERPGHPHHPEQVGHGLRASIPTRTARRSGSTARAAAAASAASGAAPCDGRLAYFGVNGTLSPTPGGMRAVKIDTGEEVWSKAPEPKLCGNGRGCSARRARPSPQSRASCFSGSADGGLRAYATDDGTLVWSFDTNKEFTTVNGVKANGAAHGRSRRRGRPTACCSSTPATAASPAGRGMCYSRLASISA